MSVPSLRWRHLLEALAGLAIGLVCLVAFSGSASAAEVTAPTPPPAPTAPAPGLVTGLLGVVQPTLDPVLAPIDQGVIQPTLTTVGATLDGVVPGLGTTVQGTVDGLGTTVQETVTGLGTTVDGLVTPIVGTPSSPLPTLPGVVDGVTPPRAGPIGSAIPGALLSDPTTALATDAGTGSAPGTELRSGSPSISTVDGAAADLPQFSAAPIHGDSPSSVPGPLSLPLAVVSTVGSALSTGSAGAGGLLLAILVGATALVLRPVQSRLAVVRLTSPLAPSFAISVPPG